MSPRFTFSPNFLRKDVAGARGSVAKSARVKTRLVVAIDVPTFVRAKHLIVTLAGIDVTFKVGYEALYGYGPELLGLLESRGAAYMLDVKLHDIPRTVHAAVHALVRPGVALLTVHALGGAEMLAAAAEAAAERAAELGIPAPGVLAITILTSLAAKDLRELGLGGGAGENASRLAALARDARCAGIVCSVAEVAAIKSACGDAFIALCPGIRPGGSAHGDQRRIATPGDARAAGADYIVVGRPIVEDADPAAAARAILAELN
jgi:orotidine-5'-phosphate decarboxylase